MKTKNIIILVTAMMVMMTSCVKEFEKTGLSNTIEYTGTVVLSKGMQPLSGIKVQVTNGSLVIASTKTDGNGKFSLKVNFDKVDDDCCLIIDGFSVNMPSKTMELRAAYHKKYDYGTLKMGFPTFYYNGHTYMVAPNSNTTMEWADANSYCNNLTCYGYADWRMPTKSELLQMYNDKNTIGDFISGIYWSSTAYSSCYYYVSFYDGHSDYRSASSPALVRPIRVDH